MPRLVSSNDTLLLVIDIQEKLLPHMTDPERVVERSVRMIEGAKATGVPTIVTEQYPKGIGPTVEPVRAALADAPVLEKTTFSCMATSAVVDAVRATGARNVLLVGIEAHVCVAQTALDLLDMGLAPHVVSDAVSSRCPENLGAGLDRMRQAGAVISTSEMSLFELVGDASSPAFKPVLKLVK